MALVSIGGTIDFPTAAVLNSTSSGASIGNSTSYSTSGTGYGYIFKVPKAGTLTRIPFYASSVGVAGTVNCSFQTVSGTTPSGTLYGGSAAQAVALTTAGAYEAVLSTPATAVAGDIVAAVITCDGTLTPTWTLGIIANASSTYELPQFPYPLENTGSWAALSVARISCLGVGYSSTDYISFRSAIPISAINSTNASSSAAVRKYGALFTPSFPMTISGVRWTLNNNPWRAGSFQILDSAGTATLATATITLGGGLTNSGLDMRFDAGATLSLTAGTQYRVVYVPSTTSNTAMADFTLPNTGCMSSMSGGPNFWVTTADASNVWTDTATTRYPFQISLRVTQLDDGTGGTAGILVNSGMTGGMK